jgi:hypothetical protein
MLHTLLEDKENIQKIKEIIDAGVIFAYDDRAERIYRLVTNKTDYSRDISPLTKMSMLIEELEDSLERNQRSPEDFMDEATSRVRLLREELRKQGVMK